MTAVHIGGVRLVFSGAAAEHLPEDELGAFLAPRPVDAEVLLVCRSGVPGPPHPAATFTYARHNLRFELLPGGRAAHVWTDGTHGPLWAAMELALNAAVQSLDGLVVHAACGVVGGVAWLMPGVSGAGKSTAAREAGFERVLSDEMVVVRRTALGWRAFGTPFWSRGRRPVLDAGDGPLGLLADLVKDVGVAVAPWPREAAAAGLLACVTRYDTSAVARRRDFERACDLVEAVPCVRLSFPKEGPWLSAARAAVHEASSSTPSSGPSRSGSTGTSPGGATTSASTAI